VSLPCAYFSVAALRMGINRADSASYQVREGLWSAAARLHEIGTEICQSFFAHAPSLRPLLRASRELLNKPAAGVPLGTKHRIKTARSRIREGPCS